MSIMKQLASIEAWIKGSAAIMCDDELELAREYFSRLDDALRPCPPAYKLVRDDARKQLDAVKDVIKARKEKRR